MISIPASTKLCDKICMTLDTIVLICVIAHRCVSKNFVPALIHCSGVGMGWGAGSWELAHPLILHSFFLCLQICNSQTCNYNWRSPS